MLDWIINKIKSAYQHAQNKKAFKAQLLAAVEHGKLSSSEISTLSAARSNLGITDDDVWGMRVQAFDAAFQACKGSGSLTEEQERDLKGIQTYLKIADEDIDKERKEIARLRLIFEISAGHLPTVEVHNVVLHKGETPHWSEPASLLEERVISRRYEGGSQGISVRLMKGVSYRVGASKGHLVSDKAIVPVSTGSLVITNQRVLFSGSAKSFATRLDKILNIEPLMDGLKLSEENGKLRLVKYENANNCNVIAAILTRVVGASS